MDEFLTDVLDCYNKSVPKKHQTETIEDMFDELQEIIDDMERTLHLR